MCGSSSASQSPMAQFLKSQTPQELWKASLKPQNPFKPEDPAKDPAKPDASSATGPITQAAKPPGTGLVVDVKA